MGVVALILMPERSCSTCTKQEEWGCNARKIKDGPGPGETEKDCWVNPSHYPTYIDNEELYVCPRRTLLDNPSFWSRLLLFYRGFEKGLLPDEGSLQDQSNAGMVALNILSSAIDQAREEQRQEKS